MMQKFEDFNAGAVPADQAIDRDLILANVSLYWFTQSFGTAAWQYYETDESTWPEGQNAVPTGLYSGPPGIRRLAERHNTIVHWPEDNPGGHHFVAMEQPDAFAADMRKFFDLVR